MNWFNYYGLIFVALIMIPNIVYGITHKNDLVNTYKNKTAIILEQVGRYACMLFMVFNIPYTWTGFYFMFGETVYIIVNAILTIAYCITWIVTWKRTGVVKALLLSIIPSMVFIFSGIMIASIPLIIFSVIFAVTHILISVKNAVAEDVSPKINKKIAITLTSIVLTIVFIAIGVFGGIIFYQQGQLSKLDGMTAMDMLKYCASGKDKKISVAIIDDGEITYRVFGSNGEENDSLYDYEIGSISKSFVGLLSAKAIKEGKLSLSDNIAKYLGFDDAQYYPSIERLLTHTSGYKSYYFDSKMIGNKLAQITNDYYGISRSDILNKAKGIKLENRDYPFEYSNFGISVLGLVLEKIYNDSFTNLMNNYISSELGLSNTRVAGQSGNLNKYWKWDNNDGYIPAGSIISNIRDMASYLYMYMSGAQDYNEMTCAKIKEINANNAVYEKMNIRMDSVGMTWMIDEQNNIIWHNGATSGFNSYIGFTKDKKKGVVVLSNLNANDKISMTVIGAKLLMSQGSL